MLKEKADQKANQFVLLIALAFIGIGAYLSGTGSGYYGDGMVIFGIGMFIGTVLYKVKYEEVYKKQSEEKAQKEFVEFIKQHKDDKVIKDYYECVYGDKWYQKLTGEK